MALTGDKDGFLSGPKADINPAAFGRHIELLRAIRGDVSGIRQDLSAIRKALAQPSRARLNSAPRLPAGVTSTQAARPKAANSPAYAQAAQASKPAQPSRQSSGKPVAPANPSAQASPAARPRKANGQFGAGGGNGSGEEESRRSRDSVRKFSEAAADLKRGAGEMMGEASQVDPAIAAAKEVKELASPVMSMLKPLGGLFRRGAGNSEEEKVHKKTLPWYRRMWGELRDLNKKGGGNKGGLNLSGIGGMLMKLPGIGVLGRLLVMLGGVIKPFVGGIGKLALPLATMFSAFKSFNTSTEEYAARMGVELNGSLAQELGVRFAGVLGDLGNTLTFGLAGKFGEMIAPAVVDAFTAVGAAWDSTIGWFKETWEGVSDGVTSTWDGAVGKATKVFDAVGDWLSQKLGIVKDAANATYDKGSEAVSSGKNLLQNAANKVTGGRYKGGSNANKASLVEAMNGAGIKDPKEQAMFMAQMDHESGGFKNYEENLNYSAKGLRKTFGKYYGTDAEAEADARNPEAIANKVYGGRMGNKDPGDGFKFRGRGAVQLTGRDNYDAAGKALGLDLVNNPDLAQDPANAGKIAAWYWKKNNLGAAGKAGDVTAATRKINGGTNGLSDRKEKYASYLKDAEAGGLTMQTANASTATPPAAVSAAISASTSMPSVPRMLAPVSVSSPAVRYAAAGQDVSKFVPSPAPAAKVPLASSGKDKSTSVRVETPLSQDVADRNIAAVATGGLGMGPVR